MNTACEHDDYDIVFLDPGRATAYAVTITCGRCGAVRLDDFEVDAYLTDRDDDGDPTDQRRLRIEFVNRTGRDVLATYNGVAYEFAGTLNVEAPVKIVRDPRRA